MKKYIGILVIGLATLYLWNKYYNQTTNPNCSNDLIIKLVNKSKLSLNKSKQSNKTMLKLIFSNYSMANIYMLEALSNNSKVKNVTGESLDKLYDNSFTEQYINEGNPRAKNVRYLPISDLLDVIKTNNSGI